MEIDQDFSFGFKDELIFVDDLSLNDIREEEVIAVQDIELSEDACVGDDASKEGFTSNGSHDPQSDLYQESQPETYECGHCSKKFNTRAKMLKHYQLYHQENVQTSCDGKRSWSCSQCDKQFASRKGWIIHQRSHSGEKPYTCLICGKSFIDSSTLMKHQVIHQDTRPFTCNVCGHGFNQKVALQRHEKTHNQVQEFQCGFCPKTFLVKCSLEAHEKSHTGEKLFLCKYCSRAFHTVRALKQHKRVHMVEQPPTCLQCKEEFSNLDILLEHMEVHAASPNLQCPLCSMRFNETVHLKEHIRIHVLKANERFCNLCQMVFHSKEETILHFNEHIKVGFRRVEALRGGIVEEWGSTNEDTDTYKDIGTNNDTDNMDIGTNNDSDNRDIGTNNDTDNVDIGTNNDTDNVDIGTNNDTDNVDIGTNNDTDNMDIGTNNDSDNRDIGTNNDTDNMDIVTNNDMDNMDIGTNNDTDNMDIGTNKDTDTNKNIGKRVDVVINGNKISENDEVEDGIFYENGGILLENSEKEVENSKKEIENIIKEVENVRKEFKNSSKEVENSMKEIENVRKEVKNGRKEVENGRKEVENGRKEVENGRKEVENNKKEVPRDLGKNVDLVRNNIDNNQSQSKVLLSIKRSIEYIPDQILDIIGRNPEKSNNGTANGTTIEKSKNGIANGTSIEKSKNGTATGTTIEKSKNGTTIDDLVVIDHNRKDSSNISKEIVTKVPSTQNSVEGIQNRNSLESVLELHSQQPDDNVTNSRGHLKPGGVRKTSLKVLKKKTFTKYYKKNSIQIIVKKKSSAQESVENVVDENVTETHNVVSKKNKSLANENVEKLANNSMTDTSNIVSKKKKNNSTKKHKDNDQSREGIIYYAPNSVEEHKNCNHQFLSYVEEGVQKCNLYCDSSTSFAEDNSRNKAMEEALNGVDNKIVKESTVGLNETDSQGNNYSKNDKGLVEEFSRESVIKLATIEGRVVENVQKSENVLGLQEIKKALESKKVSLESKQVCQESKNGSQESEPVLFKSKKVSQESKKVTLVIKKVSQGSKAVSQENRKVSQESKPISKDMSFQGTNSKQKSSVKPSRKQKVVEPDIEEKVEEVLQRIMEECRSFEEANKQNRTEFSGLEALCDVAESAAKELNQVENFMIKESVNCQDSMVAKSPRNETSQTPCLNDIRFFCKSCNRTYSSSFDFREHRCSMSSVRTKWTSDDAEGSKRFTCSECNKSFRSKNGFLIHRRSHTGERPYPCRWCEKAFGDSGTRHKHERIHTGERPFHCSNCPRAFNQRAALRAHQVTHAKCVTRSYMCALCPSSFTYFANLRRHVLVCHRDSNAICCPLCTFPKMLHYDMESLKAHVEDVHCTEGQKMRCFICDQNEFEDLDDFCCHISGHSKFLNGAMHNNNNDCLEEDSMEEDLLV